MPVTVPMAMAVAVPMAVAVVVPMTPPGKKQLHVHQSPENSKQECTSQGYTIMHMEKSHMADVYNVYDPKTKKKVGHAAVTTLSMSRWMHDMFKTTGLHAKVPIKSIWHEVYQKWMPIIHLHPHPYPML
jgi:hypothetical protein